MQTECSADLFGFTPVDGRAVVAAFDGGKMTSDAGAMLLGASDGIIILDVPIRRSYIKCQGDRRMSVLSEPQYHNEAAAYAFVEAHLW